MQNVSVIVNFTVSLSSYNINSIVTLQEVGEAGSIACPGDIFSYECWTYGNYPLSWTIYLQSSTLEHQFRSGDEIGRELDLGPGISVVLIEDDNMTLASLATLTVLEDESWDGARVKCSIKSKRSDFLDTQVHFGTKYSYIIIMHAQ